MSNHSLLRLSLEVAVPLALYDLRQKGGPDEEDWHFAREYGAELAEKGDILLYKSKKEGQSADQFSKLARVLAILAYVPGGITFNGMHFEVGGRVMKLWSCGHTTTTGKHGLCRDCWRDGVLTDDQQRVFDKLTAEAPAQEKKRIAQIVHTVVSQEPDRQAPPTPTT